MKSVNSDLDRLNRELQALIQRHNAVTQDLKKLRDEIRLTEAKEKKTRPEDQPGPSVEAKVLQTTTQPKPQAKAKVSFANMNLERFIGENLISKVGILVTIIGVIIGAKYTIENNLISPTVRIIIGYLLAFGLLFFGFRLKEKYNNYSAVLVSGAVAIMYFLTYAAFSFYNLIPLSLAFALMVIWIAFGVFVAIYFSRQVIAIIGLVGAYAIPFLLSPEDGNPVVLLSYISLLNVGLLTIAYWKEWRLLNYTAFGFTWLIFLFWFGNADHSEATASTALLFGIIFFLIFYLMFLSYKLIKREAFQKIDIVLILLNSFIFYGLGYTAIGYYPDGRDFLGLFTILNAVVHLIVAMTINRYELGDKQLFYFTLVLVITYITIAIPVQLGGVWTTMLWSVEAAVLFWIGQQRKIAFYERVAYPMIVLAFFALVSTWGNYNSVIYGDGSTPVFNRYFLTSFLFLLSIGLMNYLGIEEITHETGFRKEIRGVFKYALPTLLLFAFYITFLKEIDLYWENVARKLLYGEQSGDILNNKVISHLKNAWIVAYTLGMASALAVINMAKIKSRLFTTTGQILVAAAVFFFLTGGLFSLSELRQGYLDPATTDYLQHNTFNLWLRYIVSLFFFAALYLLYRYNQLESDDKKRKFLLVIYIHAAIVWFASSELIHWLDLAGYPNAYKIWLSILWGAYAVYLIAWGIYLKKKYLRISAIALLGVTLVKLVLYDITTLDTLRKTIVFVVLGLLLLIASFLYNKYKGLIFDSDDT